jgi:hypothetical protein
MGRRDDGEAERRRKLELTGVVVRSFRCMRAKLGELGEHQWVAAMLQEQWIEDGKRHGWLSTAARGCGEGPARSCARGEEMPWNRGARVSKEDHRAAAEHVLRSGEAQHAGARAGDAGGTRGGSSGGGATWRGRSRPARGREGGGQGVGGYVAQLRAARGRRVRGTWPAKRQQCVEQRNRGGGDSR